MQTLKYINWSFVKNVSDVNMKDKTVVINYIDGQEKTTSVPEKLMQALISRGEQNFIDQEIQISEWNPDRPD